MAKTVTASEDWLSYALAEYDTDKIAASTKRAEAALKVRLNGRVMSFLKKATDAEELGERLDVVDPAVQEIVNEVATEYGASPEHLFEAAVKHIAVDDYFNQPFQQQQTGVPPHGYTEAPCQKCGHPTELGVPCKWCGAVNQPTGAPVGGGGGADMGGLRQRLQAHRTASNQCPQCGTEAGETTDSQGNVTCKACGYEKFNEALAKENEAKSNRQARTRRAAEDGIGGAYEHKTVSPDSVIGDASASAMFQGAKFDTSVETALSGSKDHPREFQSISDHVEDRRTLNDGKDKDVGVKREVKHEDLGGSNPHSEQKGKGGTFSEGTQAQAITSKFHILD